MIVSEQDREAPHREEVREARHGPAQELALARDLDELGLGARAEPLPPAGRRCARADQRAEPPEPQAREDEAHER